MSTIFQAVLAPVTTAFQALTITVLLPWFLIPALVAFVIFSGWGIRKKERIRWTFAWNLLPLLVIFPVVGLSFTVWREKAEYIDAIQEAVPPYFLTAVGGVILARKAGFLSLAAQSALFVYALGESLLCSMAITGTWL